MIDEKKLIEENEQLKRDLSIQVEHSKKLAERLKATQNLLKKTRAKADRWIPVSERLPDPEEDGQVLVTVSGTYDEHLRFDHAIELADYYGNDGWCLEAYPDWKNPNVLAWQPLPEPFKEGEKN